MMITSNRAGLLAGGIALSLVVGCAGYASKTATAPVRVENAMVVAANGLTLYTFDKDAAGSGKSVCDGPCATNWPPLLASESDHGSGNWSIVTRDDGRKQWAYKSKPLYYWIKDQKPGDKSGDGVNGVWRIAKE